MLKNSGKSLFNFNKITCLFLVICILLSTSSLSFVQAAEQTQELWPTGTQMDVEIANVSGVKGDTVEVPVYFENVPDIGIYTCSLLIGFDASKLEVVDINYGELIENEAEFNSYYNNTNDNEFAFAYASMTFGAQSEDVSEKIIEDGNIAKIKFKLLDDVEVGDIFPLVNYLDRSRVYANAMNEITNVKFNNGSINVTSVPIPTAVPTEIVTATPTSAWTPTVVPTATPTFSPIATQMDVKIGSVSGVKGDTVEVPVYFENVPDIGIGNCSLFVEFDASKLEVVDIKYGDIIENALDFYSYYRNDNDNKLATGYAAMVFVAPSDDSRSINEDGNIAKIVFKLLDGVEVGDVYSLVNYLDRSCIYADANNEIKNVKFTDGLITVLETPKPTEIPTSTPVKTATPEPTETPTSTPVNTATPEPTETPTSTPVNTATPEPTETSTSTPVNTETPKPTETPTSTPVNTATPKPTETSTSTPVNTATTEPTETPTSTPVKTATPKPTETPTSTPVKTATPKPTETSTSTPVNTATPKPTETPTSTPVNTATPEPTETSTSTPVNTATPKPTETSTSTPVNTATPKPTETPTSTPVYTVTPSPTDTHMNVSVGRVNGVKGSKVEVPVYLHNIPQDGVYTCSLFVIFDATNLEVVAVKPGELIKSRTDFTTNFDNDNDNFVKSGFASMVFQAPIDDSRIITEDGIVANIEFKVLDSAEVEDVYLLINYLDRSGFYIDGVNEITEIKYNDGSITVIATPEPTQTPTPTAVPTEEPTQTPKPTVVPTEDVTPTPKPTAEPTGGVTPTPKPTAEPTVDVTSTPAPTAEPTGEVTPTPTPTVEPTGEVTPTPTPTAEPTGDATSTPAPTAEPTGEVTPTPTPTVEPTGEVTPTPTPTVEPTGDVTPTPTPTVEPTGEVTPTPTPTVEPTGDVTPTPTLTQSATPRPTSTKKSGGGSSGGSKSTPKPTSSATPTPSPTVVEPTPEVPGVDVKSHSAYLKGYPNGLFLPENNITRAEAATILAKLSGADITYTNDQMSFPDVEETHWALWAIKYSTDKGYFVGYTDGTFKPDQSITRAEFATIVYHFLGIKDEHISNYKFEDVKGHWAQIYIEKLTELKYISGYPDGTFQPQSSIKRCESVAMLNRALNRGPLYGSLQIFPDVPKTHWAFKDIAEGALDHSYIMDGDIERIYLK